MFLQYTSRGPRTSGGLKVKHVFQIAFILAVGMWLLYQAYQSQLKNSDYGEDHSGEKTRKLLGSGWKVEKKGYNGEIKSDASKPEFEYVAGKEHSESKYEDVSERHFEQMEAEDETTNKESEDLEGKFPDEREGEAETEPKNHHGGDEVEQSNGEGQMKSGDEGEVLHKDNNEEKEAEKEQENQHEEEKGEETDTQGSKTIGVGEMEAADKDTTHEENNISDQGLVGNRTQEFTDENGIPKEENDSPLISRDNETKAIDQETSSDQETIAYQDIGSEHGETVVPGSSNSSLAGKQLESVEVETQEGKHALKEDAGTNVTSEGSKRETDVGKETNQTSETAEGDNTDSASSSMVSQEDKEEELDLKTRAETDDETKNKELPSDQMS
ncbi:hypothetical protein ACLOJK_021117 [Asimina triloba]